MAYRDSGNMHEKALNLSECCSSLQRAKDIYACEGRLSECAKLAKRRAEIFEKLELLADCAESYAEAAELFDGEGQKR
eukprot:SAG11_NODE_8142_length_1055_cov_1.459205_2_plen_78_part_00